MCASGIVLREFSGSIESMSEARGRRMKAAALREGSGWMGEPGCQQGRPRPNPLSHHLLGSPSEMLFQEPRSSPSVPGPLAAVPGTQRVRNIHVLRKISQWMPMATGLLATAVKCGKPQEALAHLPSNSPSCLASSSTFLRCVQISQHRLPSWRH